jgi:hypothetical protein
LKLYHIDLSLSLKFDSSSDPELMKTV